MAIIQAVISEDWIRYITQFNGGLLGVPATTTTVGVQWNPLIKFFKYGEGGWIDTISSGRQPRDPDPALRRLAAPLIQDLDAVVDGTRGNPDKRYPADSLAVYQKNLTGADFSAPNPNTLRVRCHLDMGEFNDDGSGNPPEIWELGLFCDHPTVAGQSLMVAYATFAKQVKSAMQPLENLVDLIGSNT